MLVMQPSFRKIDFPAVLAGMTQSALPDLQTIALVDAGSDHPDAVFGRCTVAYRPGAIDAAAVPAAQADAARPVILFTTSGTTQGPKQLGRASCRERVWPYV